jgi:hypothetical protein
VVDGAVHGGRLPDDRGSDAALGQGEGRVLARNPGGRRIIQQAFDAWHQGRGAITDVFALDMVWRIEGH